METEDFKRGLSVWVVSWLEFQLLNTNLGVKLLHNAKEMTQTNVSISDETLNLVEFSKMCSI
jgi:hypothetical protein